VAFGTKYDNPRLPLQLRPPTLSVGSIGFRGIRFPLFATLLTLNGQDAISRVHRPRFWVVSRAPQIPDALTTGPFNLEEARRHGLTKDHLLGASWRRLGGGFYALRAIADDPIVVIAATSRRLPTTAIFSGRTAAWLHGPRSGSMRAD
jgi:hypothetical protein